MYPGTEPGLLTYVWSPSSFTASPTTAPSSPSQPEGSSSRTNLSTLQTVEAPQCFLAQRGAPAQGLPVSKFPECQGLTF